MHKGSSAGVVVIKTQKTLFFILFYFFPPVFFLSFPLRCAPFEAFREISFLIKNKIKYPSEYQGPLSADNEPL